MALALVLVGFAFSACAVAPPCADAHANRSNAPSRQHAARLDRSTQALHGDFKKYSHATATRTTAATPRPAGTAPQDCDSDHDAGIDPQEYAECFPAPPPPACPSATVLQCKDQSQVQQDLDNWSRHFGAAFATCAVTALGIGAVAAGAIVTAGAAGVIGGIVIGAFASACVYYMAETIGDMVYGHDPPDPNYDSIATPVAMPQPSVRWCPISHRPSYCARLLASFLTFLRAHAAAASVEMALAVTYNRQATARHDSDGSAWWLQSGAASLYNAQLLALLVRRNRAAHALLRELRRDRISFHFDRLPRRLRGRAWLRKVKPSVIDKLTEPLVMTDTELFRGVRPHRTEAVTIGTMLSPEPLTRSRAHTISYAGLDQLVRVLTEQRQSAAVLLNNDLLSAGLACNAGERVGALRAFAQDARQALAPVGGSPGGASIALATSFLDAPAVGPAAPTVTLTAEGFGFPQPSVSAGTNEIDAVEHADDSADHGHVVCRIFDFGDPGSAGNVVTRRVTEDIVGGVPHIYTRPGTYAITVTVIDDDGWKQATAGQVVTVAP